MFSIFRRKKKEDPADYVFRSGYSPHGCFLFDDGTFGCIRMFKNAKRMKEV